MKVEIETLGGTVTLENECSILSITIDDEYLFRGPACTLADILRKDKEFMEFISSHDLYGNPIAK